jgi:hypothetical protein
MSAYFRLVTPQDLPPIAFMRLFDCTVAPFEIVARTIKALECYWPGTFMIIPSLAKKMLIQPVSYQWAPRER